ncbi:MAG: hypothetical protein Q3979_05650 [Actinomycetaceae bacterium]|nr:hypothetical protein [Actinomycetaceae bacterium]
MEPDTTPTQLAHPARAVLRTLIASAVGVLVTLAARAGIDLASLAQPLVEALTAVAWAIATGTAQWILTRPAVDAFLKRFAPGLATTPRP